MYTFRINLLANFIPNKQGSRDFLNEQEIIQFMKIAQNITNYRLHNTELLSDSCKEEQFIKKYLSLAENNVLMRHIEYYRLADETKRNEPIFLCNNEAMELDDIVIDVFSINPLDKFKRQYLDIITE